MAKFRSWNEEYQMFYYFRDDLYYTFNPVEKEYSEQIPLMNGDSFDWQNAEQEINIDNDKYFVSDIGVITYLERDPTSMMGNGCKRVRVLKGIVGFDYRGLFIKDDKNCYYIADYRGRGQFDVIGNIHENKELLNEV